MMRHYCTLLMSRSIQQRIIALVLLVAYAITGTSVMPAVVSLAAWVDGSHAVIVQQSEQGMKVTLHHRSDCFTPRLADHENTLAKILVSMCSASQEGDHQMSVAHVTASTGLRDDMVRRAHSAPVLDLHEPCLPPLFVSHPVCDMPRLSWHRDMMEPRLHKRRVPTTVQLLI